MSFSIHCVGGERRLRLHQRSLRMLSEVRDLLATAGADLDPDAKQLEEKLSAIITRYQKGPGTPSDAPGQQSMKFPELAK